MTPRRAVKLDDICKLQTDHHDTCDAWIIIDGPQVTISKQRNGEPRTASVTLSRRSFNVLIDWYNRDQKVR